MRFDDRLKTVLGRSGSDAGAKSIAWRQAVDLIAQGSDDSHADRAETFEMLERMRGQIAPAIRTSVAKGIASMPIPADLVRFFGKDIPAVAAPVLRGAQMDPQSWEGLIPSLPPASRALLRGRTDLDPSTRAMLDSFGRSDLGLPGPDTLIESTSPSQIGELVARIEAFRRGQTAAPAVQPDLAVTRFRFEAGANGSINWVEEGPRGPVIGIDLSTMAEAGSHGVDGQVAGAFRNRAPFQDGRLQVPGEGPASGHWLLSGIPFFRETDGRFLGFRGIARRPDPGELAFETYPAVLGAGLPADSVRQLVHELRTPLNAIRGFAEMIQGQLLGPVSEPYRTHAEKIITDAQHLLQMFDDLDTAARLEAGRAQLAQGGSADLRAVLDNIARDYAGLTDRRQVRLQIARPTDSLFVVADALASERMLGRLLSTMVGLAQPGEILTGRLGHTAGGAEFRIDRPRIIGGFDEATLIDPAFGSEIDSPDGPALGLAFALRLIGGMAAQVGGKLNIDQNAISILLPLAEIHTNPASSQS